MESNRTNHIPLLLPAPGPRKAAICALVPPCALGAEIGADHGIISAHLLRDNTCARMVVADISAASLSKAQRLFALHGLTPRAEFRVADGLTALDTPVGAIVIAGMGARTMHRLLSSGVDHIGDAALVLQPSQDVVALRRWLTSNNFRIDAESLAREGDRFYIALRAYRGHASYTPRELLLGPCLLSGRPPDYHDYLRWRIACLRAMRREDTGQEIAWMEEELTK